MGLCQYSNLCALRRENLLPLRRQSLYPTELYGPIVLKSAISRGLTPYIVFLGLDNILSEEGIIHGLLLSIYCRVRSHFSRRIELTTELLFFSRLVLALFLRRLALYPTELQTQVIKNILPFWQWICQCLICWERGGEKRLYSPPPSVIMGRKSGSDRRRRTEPVRNIEKRAVNLWTERRSSRAARCPRSSPGI